MALHTHHKDPPSKRNLLISIILNFVITIAEFIGGILSNSLALLSDALHNLSDAFALLISYLAMIVSKKRSTSKNTFGYERVEILAALLNAIILIVISIYLFYEAYERLIDPQPIKGMLMFIVAGIGLIANIVSVLLLHRGSKSSLNIKAAYFHLIGDTVSSVGVIIASVIIYFSELYWIDSLLTFLIGIYILYGTYGILKETIEILMQSTPSDINIKEIKSRLESHPKIENVHHIHVWRLSDHRVHFECHADVDKNYSIEETDQIREELSTILYNEFQIQHITIQMEHYSCDDKNVIVGR
ncbi:MAG: cation diffusion facilitator family transporter [Bacteroidales bacterium]